VTYRRLASPLHAARASAGALFCLVLAAGALLEHPLLLGAVAVAVLVSAAGAGVLGELGRTAKYVVPLAIVFGLINPLVVREGLTVFARLGEIPPFGQVDLTVEALLYGCILGARIVVVALAFALFTACVDPDELLKLFRRVSFRSALTATLATRLVPVLARDAQRLDQARRSRADGGDGSPPTRAARVVILRAVASGALDRAVDVAATLEVRGYGATHRGRAARRPWSRHDLAFLAAAVALVAVFVGSAVLDVGRFEAYPLLQAPVGAGELAAALTIVLVSGLPFLDRRGIEP
jgi:energy-coupling factor transport system permease protein